MDFSNSTNGQENTFPPFQSQRHRQISFSEDSFYMYWSNGTIFHIFSSIHMRNP